jgi:DinB superfamily
MDLRYPIGPYHPKTSLTPEERAQAIAQLAEIPKHMRDAVGGLSGGQLDTPYRPGGWTLRQVAHHVPDSHMNAYVRMKLALTETEPTVRPYEESLWAELADSRQAPVEVSLSLLEFLHLRWDLLLHALPPEVFARTLRHPVNGVMTIDNLIHHYAWHGRHHIAHITGLRQREGWD